MPASEAAIRPDHVTRAANGVEKRLFEILLDLAAKTGDMHIDHIGLRVEVIVPHILKQHGACNHLPGMPHQVLEQAKLARLERNFLSCPAHTVREAIELQVADLVERL